jgi:hypothetical protein
MRLPHERIKWSNTRAKVASEGETLNVAEKRHRLKGLEIAGRLNAEIAEVNGMHWELQNRGLTRQNSALPLPSGGVIRGCPISFSTATSDSRQVISQIKL